jgi:putative DNA-invertase from lambdoid prophage Rac
MDTMRTVIYARVSTAEQSCEMQLRELRDYAARRGLEVVAEYVDTGWSGAKASRPALDRLMRDARMRRFDAVVVWKLDRWGRSVAHCVRSVQELASLGVPCGHPEHRHGREQPDVPVPFCTCSRRSPSWNGR